MENKDQYKQSESDGIGGIAATKPQQITTRTPTDIKISQLEEQITSQHQQMLKLKRDIARLKNDISEVINTLNNRRG